MSAFEFLFSLFGLMLGFSIAEIASGFSRVYDARASRPIGGLAPALAALLLLDLLTLWYAGWEYREMLPLNMVVLIGAGIVGLLYYFAATQVFPREGSSTAPPDHMMGHRRPVIIAVIASNLILYTPAWVISVVRHGWDILLEPELFVGLAYLALLAIVGFSRRRGWISVALASAIILLLVTAALGV